MRSGLLLVSVFFLFLHNYAQDGTSLTNTKIPGYRGIWFELGQKYMYGDKYSGALGTYTAKHLPLAAYSQKVNKTFFVYGGTTAEDEKHLLCMIGEYDHRTGTVSKPVVVYDKKGVNDPHDNPSLLIDRQGYIFVFVSGRNVSRPGYKFRSKKPFCIDAFEQITEEEMTYPQPWSTDFGYFHFFTKYSGVRNLYFETSSDGINWTDDKLLAAIPEHPGEKSGHYQISNIYKGQRLGTFFNRHPQGDVDKRTDLYYLQTQDFGKSWTNASGKKIKIPVLDINSPALVIAYNLKKKNVYLKDMGFDNEGNPVCLYIRSNGFKPGPDSAPYEWCVTMWNGKKWQTTVITVSDHNYDMGSLFIENNTWRVVGPTEPGPQKWGVGGELVSWISNDAGLSWRKERQLTFNSRFNHAYVRRPLNLKEPFCFFWASGDAHKFSRSEIWFGDFKGNVWKLPYEMREERQKPVKLN